MLFALECSRSSQLRRAAGRSTYAIDSSRSVDRRRVQVINDSRYSTLGELLCDVTFILENVSKVELSCEYNASELARLAKRSQLQSDPQLLIIVPCLLVTGCHVLGAIDSSSFGVCPLTSR